MAIANFPCVKKILSNKPNCSVNFDDKTRGTDPFFNKRASASRSHHLQCQYNYVEV